MAVLELMNIWAGRRGKEALRGASLSIEAGDAYLLVGKPGSGKTCLLGVASGQTVPRSGTVRLFGAEYAKYSRRVGAVVGHPAFFAGLTVKDNLMARAISLGVPRPDDVVGELLARFALDADANAKMGPLPAGAKAWASLAWGLIGSPDLLVLDDILLGLDPVDRSRMVAVLRRLVSETGLTLFIAAREAGPLMPLATRIGILAEGCIRHEYTPDELRDALRQRVRVRTSNIETTLARLESELSNADIVLTGHGSLEVTGSDLDEISRLLDRFPERIVELTETSVLASDVLGEGGPIC
ncbi:MAG: ATP-binding cassette domain-containing protein [Coriobacteriia bacterium]|nr:ATP-binding cassette domain-containing protein [Coriobacteriia bacterium]